ncbi:MAG: hypothetical protein JSV44_11055 [Candidatus Zixiibacteriota bacterium]|nr:MAG: hypothetical protein JSV44_11055 [candidate division Zixibacteria bacterium]
MNICNNLRAINLVREIGLSVNLMNRSMERLASGLRINRASDDPAGLVISEQMRSRIASLNQEIENTTVTLNKYRTADSAALQLRHSLTELRSYAVAAANSGANDAAVRQAYQTAAENMVSSYNSLIETTSFGNQKLLDGSEGSVAEIEKLNDLDFSDPESIEQAITEIDQKAEQLDSTLISLGSKQKNELERNLSTMRIEVQNLAAAESQIRDTDFVSEYAAFMRNSLMLQAGVALMAHANLPSYTVLSLLNSD